ncbi:MAG: DEDD exonuclease domain-containing protein [Streptosporangiales bacterium]|nr:DEDD exonuclease domain-containing protein [Streptosporangiales bacterium]
MNTSTGHAAAGRPPVAVQQTLDDLGTPLSEVTFVVVDLETTGGPPGDSAITEIGAVKVRGGEVLGEFGTLVDPGGPIPPFISVLTGITDIMLAAAPRIEEVLPAFLEFAHGAVLVAHNAGYDTGFLKAACAAQERPWPRFTVIDTVTLARRALIRDEVPNHRLATLARHFRSGTTPCHRALDDARATVDVLHGLFERLGAFGVESLEELRSFSRAPTPGQRRNRHLADEVPAEPGVYMFIGPRDEVLYVGKSTNLRSRVRSYFTASETRGRVREMVGIAERVKPIVCSTGLEAEVRELRLIAEHKPRYNRRSRFPERSVWVKLTAETFPRLSLVRQVRDDGATYLGPFASSRPAELARDALLEAFPLRRCTMRLGPCTRAPACALAGMGRCGAPCEGHETPEEYAAHAGAARAAMIADPGPVAEAVRARVARLSAQLRFEEAATHRDRLAAFVRGATRLQRLTALAGCAHLVAARPAGGGRWDLSVVRHGRLAAAGVLPPGAHPVPFVASLVSTAETVRPGPGPAPAAGAEEMECVLKWLCAPGVRLVEIEGTWSCPVRGAERLRGWIDRAQDQGRPRR